MEIKLNSIGLAITLLALLNVSIPAAMSKPKPRPTVTQTEVPPRPVDPNPSSPWVQDIKLPMAEVMRDLNPDGAQVRVKFELRDDDKFSCDKSEVEVEIFGDALPGEPGRLIAYPVLRTYTASTLIKGTNTNTCLYNFNLRPQFIGRVAKVKVYAPNLQKGRGYFSGETPATITRLNQIFSVKASNPAPPN
jgi:hypothetical protein